MGFNSKKLVTKNSENKMEVEKQLEKQQGKKEESTKPRKEEDKNLQKEGNANQKKAKKQQKEQNEESIKQKKQKKEHIKVKEHKEVQTKSKEEGDTETKDEKKSSEENGKMTVDTDAGGNKSGAGMTMVEIKECSNEDHAVIEGEIKEGQNAEEKKEGGEQKAEKKESEILQVKLVDEEAKPDKTEEDTPLIENKKLEKVEAPVKETEKETEKKQEARNDKPIVEKIIVTLPKTELKRKDSKDVKKVVKLEFKNRSESFNAERSIIQMEDHKLKKHDSKKKRHHESRPKDAEEGRAEFFGVKSYLHNFYETVNLKNPQMYEDIYEEEAASIDNTKTKRNATIYWRLALFVGAVILVLGVLFLFIGYLTPIREVIAGYQDEMQIIDRDAARFNQHIKLCRIIGLVLFCSGGCIFCTALLLSVLNNADYDEDDYRDALESFCVPMSSQESINTSIDGKIPATEELAIVQPKREEDEMVMTKSGLCKPNF